jgi:hypothetical protein
MPMPMVAPRLASAGLKLLSYSRFNILGSHCAAISGCS